MISQRVVEENRNQQNNLGQRFQVLYQSVCNAIGTSMKVTYTKALLFLKVKKYRRSYRKQGR